jgi:hypothetical protein
MFWLALTGWASLMVLGAGVELSEPDPWVIGTVWVPGVLAVVVLVGGGARVIHLVSAAVAIMYAVLSVLHGGPLFLFHALIALAAAFWSVGMAVVPRLAPGARR